MVGDQIVAIALAKKLGNGLGADAQDVKDLKNSYITLRDNYTSLEQQFDNLYTLVKKFHPDNPIYTESGYLLTTENDDPIEFDTGGI